MSHVVLLLLVSWSNLALPQEGLRTRKTKEAIVKSNTSKEIAESVGQRIDNFCAVFGSFFDELGLDKKSDNKLVARLFDTYEEYEAQFKRNHEGDAPLAYFSGSLNAIVLFNDEADITLRQTLFHECSHQYLYRYTSDAPKWLSEGLAEYFEGWRMTGEGKLVEKRANLYDLKLLQDALRAGKSLAPRELVATTAEQFDSFAEDHPDLDPYLHYATSWSLVYFSLDLSDDKKDRRRVVDYLDDLCAKGTSADFEIEDWDAFEARWKQTILGLEAKPVDAVDHLLLAAGYQQSQEFEQAATLYQGAFEKDAALTGALYGVGYCKKRMGEYDDALLWLEKARKADPKDPSVPYQMARIALGYDKEDAPSDPKQALALAEEASKLAGGKAPQFLELVAVCHAAAGDSGAAQRTINKILKLVEDDDERAYYEELAKELR